MECRPLCQYKHECDPSTESQDCWLWLSVNGTKGCLPTWWDEKILSPFIIESASLNLDSPCTWQQFGQIWTGKTKILDGIFPW
jgi:hypothetical protein